MKLLLVPLALVLFSFSPFLLWQGEVNRHGAGVFVESFDKAQAVDPNQSVVEGNIKFSGIPETTDVLACPSEDIFDFERSCVYVHTRIFEYREQVLEECEPEFNPALIDTEEVEIIEELGEKCVDGPEGCRDCYLTKAPEWVLTEDIIETAEFSIGNYQITDLAAAEVIGTESLVQTPGSFPESFPVSGPIAIPNKSTPAIGDIRIEFEFLPADQELFVSGLVRAESSVVSGAGKTPFVVSGLTELGTVSDIAGSDFNQVWGLRFLSLVAIVVSLGLLTASLSPLRAAFLSVLPKQGDFWRRNRERGSFVIAVILGSVIWGIMFIATIAFMNMTLLGVVTILALVVLGGIFFGGRTVRPQAGAYSYVPVSTD